MPEALLSVFVVSVGLLSVLGLMTSTLRNVFDARNEVIATALAQEGVELIANVHSNNLLASPSTPFDHFPVSMKQNCYIDIASFATPPAVGSNMNGCTANGAAIPAAFASLHLNGGRYSYAGATATLFSRVVWIDTATSATQVTALSFVAWGSGTLPNNGDASQCTIAKRCVYARTVLQAWK